MQLFEINPILERIFGREWLNIRFLLDDAGTPMHMAYDICTRLGITNVSTAIRGINGQDRVEIRNRNKELIPDWCSRRKIHFVTLSGVYQLILNNNPRNSSKCRELRNRVGNYLSTANNVVLSR